MTSLPPSGFPTNTPNAPFLPNLRAMYTAYLTVPYVIITKIFG
jgi:hypothetical protein